MAAAIGADVPYFLGGGTALGVSRGDQVSPLADTPRAWVVLIVPGFGVSTKDAFGWWDGQVGRKRGLRKRYSNDLQGAVAKRHPIINRLVAALERQGAFHASLSGSGSVVFGLFTRRFEAERAAHTLAGRRRRVLVTRTINRAEHRRLAAK
jgi:4-diphosphocytidyl-2-C-methyl-D-erythritol kinase